VAYGPPMGLLEDARWAWHAEEHRFEAEILQLTAEHIRKSDVGSAAAQYPPVDPPHVRYAGEPHADLQFPAQDI